MHMPYTNIHLEQACRLRALCYALRLKEAGDTGRSHQRQSVERELIFMLIESKAQRPTGTCIYDLSYAHVADIPSEIG